MNITLNANQGWLDQDFELTAGVIDDTARHVFTRGHCHSLALALHEATGWDIVGTTSWPGQTPDHVGVLVKCGRVRRVLDIAGLHKPDEWLLTYGGRELCDVDPDEARNAFDNMYREPEVDAARHWVYPVLRQYVPAATWIGAA